MRKICRAQWHLAYQSVLSCEMKGAFLSLTCGVLETKVQECVPLSSCLRTAEQLLVCSSLPLPFCYPQFVWHCEIWYLQGLWFGFPVF